MALANYNDLQNAVIDWLARENDTQLSDRMADLIALAEMRIFYGAGERGQPLYSQPFRCRYNEKLADLTIDEQSVDLPADYLALRRFYLTSIPYDLQYLAPDDFWRIAAQNITGTPHFYTIESGKIFFDLVPEASHTGKINYFFKPDNLSVVNTTNGIFSLFPNLYLYATLLEASCFIDEAELQNKYYTKYAAAMAGILSQNQEDRYGASPLMMRAG